MSIQPLARIWAAPQCTRKATIQTAHKRVPQSGTACLRCRVRALAGGFSLASVFLALSLSGCTGSASVSPRPPLPSMDSTLIEQETDDSGIAPAEIEDSGGDPSELTVSADPVPCCNPLSIDFTAEVGDAAIVGATYFEWDFGDGRNGTGPAVNHTYAWADRYTVTVTAYLPGGETTVEEFTLELGSDGTDDPVGPTPPDVVGPAEGPETDPPTADAGPDQQVSSGDTVRLDGSASRPSGAGSLSYTWAQVSGPTVALSGINSAVARFTAPVPEAGQERLVFQLSVAQAGATAVDVVVVWVEQQLTEPMEVEADAGLDQTVEPGAVVRLDGSGSSAPATPPAEYLWTQVTGAAVTLSGADSTRPSFVAPDLGASGGELRFELRVTSGEAWDTDVVNVRVSGAEETTPEAPPVRGFRVVFLSGPESDTEPGPAEVSWHFVDAPGVSGVFLRWDCCACQDTDTQVLTPDDQGVYHATIDVPEDETIWYYVHYMLNGTEYVSQSVYVNTPPGDPTAAPAPVIWYHSTAYGRGVLDEVIRSGAVTHILVAGRNRSISDHDDPEIRETIRLAQSAGLKVIWGRRLWNAWTDFQDLEDTFDPEFYATAVAEVQSEAIALGADFTALDCECYGIAPLDDYLAGAIPEENFLAMQAAVQQAAEQGTVDFVYPCGSYGEPLHPNGVYGPLGNIRIAESTYWDIGHKLCRMDYPFEIFGAYVQPTTERSENGDAPYFLPQDIVRRRYLWSQQDGAPELANGLFLYPGGPESVVLETATMLADEFDQGD